MVKVILTLSILCIIGLLLIAALHAISIGISVYVALSTLALSVLGLVGVVHIMFEEHKNTMKLLELLSKEEE